MDTALRHLTDRIRAARAAGTRLCIRGHGSKDFYGESIAGERLDTSILCGILSYEPSELVVRVAAGTPLAELEAALSERGQCLPFEPPHFGNDGGTCGGMVAAGLSGPARASAGSVRDHVLGVRMINGRGELLRFGGEVMKNVAGYDVSRLMVGAWGTLGVLTDVAIKVLPRAPAQATLRFELDQTEALTRLHGWLAQPLPINASCWVRDDTPAGHPPLLFVRLRGAIAAVEEACTRLLAEVPGQRLGPETDADWDACRDQRLPFFTPPAPDLALWRLSLPQTTPALNLPQAQLVEWHGAQRWLWAPVADAETLRALALQHGGSATIFRAPSAGNTGAGSRLHPLKPAELAIHQRLKAAFDPDGIFNPGRLSPVW